jgi:DNA-binding HxlR family transcriptional regulator
MSSKGSKINVVELLEKKGFYEVLYSVAIKNKTRWIDIVYTVQSLKGPFSPTTIRQRLEDLEEINFLEKKAKPKARAEYTYHATAIAKRYAKAIGKMIAETSNSDKEDFLLIDDPELVNEVITEAVKQGYDSPQDLIRAALNKLAEER